MLIGSLDLKDKPARSNGIKLRFRSKAVLERLKANIEQTPLSYYRTLNSINLLFNQLRGGGQGLGKEDVNIYDLNY